MNVNRVLSTFLFLPLIILLSAANDKHNDMIMSIAPPVVQWLPKMLNNPSERDDYPYSCLALVGKPGVGKTSMAYTVAEEAGWESYYIHQGHLSDRYRNASSKKLQDMLEDVIQSGEKTLIIFDEFNSLLENYDSSNHDTDTLSRTAWCFLDEQQKLKNYNIFAIATMNRIYKIPEEFKTRLLPSVEYVEDLKDKKQIQECFLNHFESSNVSFSEESREYLNKRFSDLNIINLRTIASCASIIKTYALANTKQRPVSITPTDIDGAIEKYKFNVDLMQFGHKSESDEDRRFNASQELQWKQFKMNFGMSVLGFTTQTGLALWQAYTNQQQFAESAKWHLAGLGLNMLQAVNAKKQFDMSMEFQREQFEAQQANAKTSVDLQQKGLDSQQKQFSQSHKLQKQGLLLQATSCPNKSIKGAAEQILPILQKQSELMD